MDGLTHQWRLPECLSKLAESPRWVGWRWENRKDKAGVIKPTKPPFQVNGTHAHNDKPETWATFEAIDAVRHRRRFDGVGVQLLNLEGFAALDLDKVRDPETGAVLPWAEKLIACGSYAELTPSGTGFRVLGRVAKSHPPMHRKYRHPGGGEVEFYVNTDTGRYITVTGERVDGAPDALIALDDTVAALAATVINSGEDQPDEDQPDEAKEGIHIDTGGGFDDLPEWLRTCISHGMSGDRSGDFQSAVNSLRKRGWTLEDALALFEQHPNGPAGKYAGRLAKELRRSWEKAGDEAGGRGEEKAQPRASTFYSAATLKGKPIPPREWLVPGMVPQKTVTLFAGDGGTGKSLLALQLAVAAAAGLPWLGKPVTPGNVLMISAEDDNDELHRRLADILTATEKDFDDIAGLTLRSLAGEDALLAIETEIALISSALFKELEARAVQDAPALIIIDTLADVYPANENDRAKVRQFVGILRGLALRRQCAVMLLGHPSLTGLNSGTGTSGSTAWHNSVRSRLYLQRIVQDDYEPDTRRRVLEIKKQNYGATGGDICMTWESGVFVPDAAETGLDRMAAGMKAERVFLKLLNLFTEQGRRVNAAGGTAYAPKVFSEHLAASEGVTKRAFKAAMETLLASEQIEIRTEGPPSRRVTYLAVRPRRGTWERPD